MEKLFDYERKDIEEAESLNKTAPILKTVSDTAGFKVCDVIAKGKSREFLIARIAYTILVISKHPEIYLSHIGRTLNRPQCVVERMKKRYIMYEKINFDMFFSVNYLIKMSYPSDYHLVESFLKRMR